jgi:hypothetical protein
MAIKEISPQELVAQEQRITKLVQSPEFRKELEAQHQRYLQRRKESADRRRIPQRELTEPIDF